MTTSDAIHHLSASDICLGIKSRELSARDVASAFLDRIDAIDPHYNAIISRVDRAEVVRAADAADAAVRAGDALGALHGLPMAIKDTHPTKDMRTTFGSLLFADFHPAADGVAVARLRAAGAIFIGKTNVPEFGLGSHSYNPLFGATGNAWNPDLSAGGSSGGAAVAVAHRMLPMADGSDMGGSLRNPAAWNNVFGLRPSFGRVPAWPRIDAFSPSLVTEGPIARTAGDLALLLSVQSGYDERAPLSLDRPIGHEGTGLDADLRGQRIAWLGDLGGHLPMEDGVLATCAAALDRLRGARLAVDAHVPAFEWERLWRAFVVLRQATLIMEFGDAIDDPASRAKMKPELQWELIEGRKLGLADVQRASLDRSAWYDTLLALFQTHDFVALPTAQVFPFPIGQAWPRDIAGRAMDSYHRWMEVVVPGTLSGCPVISLPAGFGPGGMPMGVQVIGRPRGELSLLRLARLYEQLVPWIADVPDVRIPAIPPAEVHPRND